MSRPLHLEGIANIRDLGGMRTDGGRMVRPGRVYRSASPHEMTPADRALLRTLGVSVIADLRSDWERDQQPYDVDFARIVEAPLASGERARSITERFMAGTMTSEELEDWWGLTGIFDAPEEFVGGIRTVFSEMLALPDSEAILYHCRGGKDRTGLVTALFLEALGVPRAAVADDFERSDVLAEGHVDSDDSRNMRRAIETMHLTPAAIRAITTVDRAWLGRLMEGIEARHGSVDAYLADFVGIGDTGLERLRGSFLTEAA